MSDTTGPRGTEQRDGHRGTSAAARTALHTILRFIARHVSGFWAAMAAFLTVSMAVGAIATALFAAFAAAVSGGLTQSFDESVLRWFDAQRNPQLDRIMMQATTLGNGAVLVMMVAIVSVFLWLTRHKWSVYILLVGIFGGKILNNILKVSFGRARPDLVEWLDHVSSKSFPSGHAMSAMIAYGSVAYLVSRLEPSDRLRAATWTITGLVILAIGISRIYLGVHYPSDVIGGFLAGLAWLAFVAASVAALQFFAPRRPETAAEERDLHAEERRAERSGHDSPLSSPNSAEIR